MRRSTTAGQLTVGKSDPTATAPLATAPLATAPLATAPLIERYRAGARIKELALRFGARRTTVSSLLGRHDVELRPVGLSPIR